VITEFFFGLATSVIGWIAGLFPEWEETEAFAGVTAVIAELFGWFVGLGIWVDWAVLSSCVALQLLVTGVVFAIKGLRAAASHIPFFGGSGG